MMKAALIAAMLAAAAVVPSIAPAQAASVTITTGGDSNYVVRERDHHDDWRWRQRHNRDRDRGWMRERQARDCEVRTVKKWRHGKMVIERTKVCD